MVIGMGYQESLWKLYWVPLTTENLLAMSNIRYNWTFLKTLNSFVRKKIARNVILILNIFWCSLDPVVNDAEWYILILVSKTKTLKVYRVRSPGLLFSYLHAIYQTWCLMTWMLIPICPLDNIMLIVFIVSGWAQLPGLSVRVWICTHLHFQIPVCSNVLSCYWLFPVSNGVLFN